MKTSRPLNKKIEHSIDGYVKTNIDFLNLVNPPTLFWNKDKSWNVIKSKIRSADRKIIVWGMALAATVSMTVAAGIHFNFISSPSNDSVIPQTKPARTGDLLEEVNKKKLSINRVFPAKNTTISKEPFAVQEIKTDQIEHENIDVSFDYNTYSFKKVISPYFTLGNSGRGIKPEVGIDVTLFKIKKNIKSKRLKLGLSTEFINQKIEQKSIITPYHFANLTFESSNTMNNKGWSIRTGVLLNPDSNYYKETTVKLVLSRKFNEWLKIGPELLFTNGLRNIYPALSISLG